MANKIITDQTLPNQFKNDGEILYGQDVNKIVSVLKEAANALKKDLDTVISGDSTTIVKYSLTELNNETAADNTYAFVYTNSGLDLYQRQSSVWVKLQEVSLLNAVTKSSVHYETLGSDARAGDLFIDYDEGE
jgi:hypothetical protein